MIILVLNSAQSNILHVCKIKNMETIYVTTFQLMTKYSIKKKIPRTLVCSGLAGAGNVMKNKAIRQGPWPCRALVW